MTAPAKPWEKNGNDLAAQRGSTDHLRHTAAPPMLDNPDLVNNNLISQAQGMYSSAPVANASASNYQHGVVPARRTRPPIPPTPAVLRQSYATGVSPYNSLYTGMTGYGGSYGGYGGGTYGMGTYGTGAYGGYSAGSYGGMMGGYGNYSNSYGRYNTMGGYGMNRYSNQQPTMGNVESRFIQLAEEGSRPTFESIESLVQTFGSVSYMMESTFGALYSSFRAVLGVAENFGRLRSLFGQVFSSFAIIRTLQWIYRKLMYYLGLRSDNPGREVIWQQATGVPADGAPKRSAWPMAIFLGLVCGAPYLVSRLLASLNIVPATEIANQANNLDVWRKSDEAIYAGVAKYDFTARSEIELSLKPKQTVYVAPQRFQTAGPEWLMVSNGRTQGIVPASYIHIMGLVKSSNQRPAHGTINVNHMAPVPAPLVHLLPDRQPEQQPEQQAFRQPEQQPEQQAFRQPEQQAFRQPEQQAFKQPEQQAVRQPEQQPEEQPELLEEPTERLPNYLAELVNEKYVQPTTRFLPKPVIPNSDPVGPAPVPIPFVASHIPQGSDSDIIPGSSEDESD